MFNLHVRFLSFFFGLVSILSFFNIIYSYYLNLYLNLDTYYYSVQITEEQICDSFTLGDLNDDGELNIFDIIILINLLFDNDYTQSGDMNEDGALNISDCVLLVNFILDN